MFSRKFQNEHEIAGCSCIWTWHQQGTSKRKPVLFIIFICANNNQKLQHTDTAAFKAT